MGVAASITALQQCYDMLRSTPAEIIEPTMISVHSSSDSSLLGFIVAPRAVGASDVYVLPLRPYTRCDRSLVATVHLSAAYLAELVTVETVLLTDDLTSAESPIRAPETRTHAAGVDVATAMLSRHLSISAILTRDALPALTLPATVLPPTAYDPWVRCAIHVPADAPAGSTISIVAVEIAGQRVPLDTLSPSTVYAVIPAPAPQTIRDAVSHHRFTPVVSPAGAVYFTPYHALQVRAVQPAMSPEPPPLSLVTLGLRRVLTLAMSDDGGVLFVGEDAGSRSRIAAVALPRHRFEMPAVLWCTPGQREFRGDVKGLACLDEHGVVVAADKEGGLHVHDMASGARLATAELSRPCFLAYDALGDVLYASSRRAAMVVRFRWQPQARRLEQLPFAAGEEQYFSVGTVSTPTRPIAVIPPKNPAQPAHLVVGKFDQSDLEVFALPPPLAGPTTRRCVTATSSGSATATGISGRAPAGSCVTAPSVDGSPCPFRLVGRLKLDDVCVVGLAASPSGDSIAVCDRTEKTIRVIPWPFHTGIEDGSSYSDLSASTTI